MGFRFHQGDRPLPGYTIQRGVGRGGFGEVYYAASDGGKEIALKYLRENPQIELRGASHCLNLKSPYLVDLHDIKQNADGDFFVIMEFVHGPSLRDLLNAEPHGLGVQKAAFLLREMAKGLAYLHDRGIVHRDLKPGNIFYEDGYVKIGDYGLAKIMTASQHSGQTVSVGTVHYMAPEVGGGNYDRTIDIYSLGVVLYEMLLGRVPFTGQTMGEVLMKHLTAQPEVDELPEPFPRIIRKALAKDPHDRYQTVNEMISEIFAAADLDRSVAAFEPASLSTVAARAARQVVAVGAGVHGGDAGAAVTPRGDAGALGTGSSNVGLGGPPPVVPPPPVARPVGRRSRADALHDRITARVEQINDGNSEHRLIVGATSGRQVAQVARQPVNRAEKIIVALLVAVGVSFGTSLLAAGGSPTFAVVSMLHVLVIVFGVILGCQLTADRLHLEGKWLTRFLILACAAVGLVPVSLLSREMLGSRMGSYWHPQDWLGALCLCMLLCDWPQRFAKGRAGRVQLGAAFSAGLFAFIVGMMLTDGQAGFPIAAIVAAASLALQAVAGIWPLAPRAVPAAAGASPMDDDDDGSDAGLDSPPVAVEPKLVASSADAEGGVRAAARGRGPLPPAVPAPPIAAGAATFPPLVRRSPGVRSLWLLTAAALLCGGITAFCASSFMNMSSDDEAAAIVAGVVAMVYFLFAFWRAVARFQTGLWRGLIRPAIFFGGLAASAGAGTAWGCFDNLGGDTDLVALIVILAGAIVSLFVWLVPVPAYVPRPLPPPPPESSDDEVIRRQRQGRHFMRIGAGLLVAMFVVVIFVLVSVPERNWDEALPVAIFPPLSAGGALLVGGYFRSRAARLVAQPRLSLPLRAVFDIDANPNLARLLERHLTMLGYTLANRSDLLWSFVRGAWAHQFWQKDVRRWATRLNVAAYELDNGGYRLTCFLDVDATFKQPGQRMIAPLADELRDLRELLGGRDAPSKAGEDRA